MAAKGEVGDIVSQAQYDYVLKQAKSAIPKTDYHHRPMVGKDGQTMMQASPLDNRGQPHRAGRDESGKIVTPGGGAADPPPAAREAMKMLMKFQAAGGQRNKLPKVSPTKNAARKDAEHAKMKNNKVIRPATRPPGTASVEREMLRRNKINAAAKINKEHAEYLSKSINEEFRSNLDEVLGL